MKTHCRFLIPLLSLVALLPVGLCAEKNDSPPPAKTERSGTTRVYVDHAAKDLPKEPVTFLGVETMPASPTLSRLTCFQPPGKVSGRLIRTGKSRHSQHFVGCITCALLTGGWL